MSNTPVPMHVDLLKDAPTSWGKWGDDDELGGLNYLGPEQVLAAAGPVQARTTFCIQRLIGDPKGDPVWPGRKPAERTQIVDESTWTPRTHSPSPAACTTPTTRSTPSCRAQRSTTHSATSGATARCGTGTTPAPASVTDTIANEVTTDPDTGVELTLHNALMRNLGVTFTEIVDLEALAADCAEDGVYEFCCTAAPIKVAQGSGAPVNPIVLK